MGIDFPIPNCVFIETRTSHATPQHTTNSSDFQFPNLSAAFRLDARRPSRPCLLTIPLLLQIVTRGPSPTSFRVPAASRERSSLELGSLSWSASLPHRYGERSSTVTVTVTVSISFLSAAAAYAVVVSRSKIYPSSSAGTLLLRLNSTGTIFPLTMTRRGFIHGTGINTLPPLTPK
jgi:hypothetical protein